MSIVAVGDQGRSCTLGHASYLPPPVRLAPTLYLPGVPVTLIGTTAPAGFLRKNGASGFSRIDFHPVVTCERSASIRSVPVSRAAPSRSPYVPLSCAAAPGTPNRRSRLKTTPFRIATTPFTDDTTSG